MCHSYRTWYLKRKYNTAMCATSCCPALGDHCTCFQVNELPRLYCDTALASFNLGSLQLRAEIQAGAPTGTPAMSF